MKKPLLSTEQRKFLQLQRNGIITTYGEYINFVYELKKEKKQFINLFKKRKK